MGFGRCSIKTTTTQKPIDATRRHKPRVHCDSFYWDISSVLIKTACLATFFVVESPRRIVSYITRKPEPKPFFTCSKWGYRMCACGHHYYHHQDVSDSEKFFSTKPIPDHPSLVTKNGAAPSNSTQKTANGISIKGGSVKDVVQRLVEQAAVSQGTESSTDSKTDSTSLTPPETSKPQKPSPETPKQKKRRRRWYWPF